MLIVEIRKKRKCRMRIERYEHSLMLLFKLGVLPNGYNEQRALVVDLSHKLRT